MSLLKVLSKNVSKLFSQSMNAITSSLENLDVNQIENDLEKMKSDLTNEMKDLKEKIFAFKKHHLIVVPFNKKTDTLSYSISNDVLTIQVSKNVNNDNETINTVNTTQVSIPENADVSNIVQKYDEEQKEMHFILRMKPIMAEEKQDETQLADDFYHKKKQDNTQLADDFSHEEQTRKKSFLRNNRLQYIAKARELKSAGNTTAEISAKLGVSPRTVRRWLSD